MMFSSRRQVGLLVAMMLALAGSAAAQDMAATQPASATPQVTDAQSTTRAARPRAATGQRGCVRAECHAGIKDQPVVHGPVAVNTCDACHVPVDVEAHTWTLARDKADLCTYCHAFSVEKMPVVHKPVAMGECLGCHDPHGGRDRTLTRGASAAEMCARCHDSIAHGKNFLHSPVEQGECDSCHAPHASRFANLLDVAGPDLCLTCHVSFDAQLAAAPVKHPALKDGCEACHDVHGGSEPMALRKPVSELCVGCHESVRQQARNARVTHSAVLEGRACVNCHTPHAGSLPDLLSDLPAKACLACHNEPIQTDRGRTIAKVTEVLDPQMRQHGPLRDGMCGGCHVAHGSDHPLLLAGAYSDRPYQNFAPEHYELCFKCHDMQLVEENPTRSATRFRNGDRNLHVDHVKDVRGKSCRLCHAAHATSGQGNVLELTSFGQWQMPVKLTRTATGGSCTPGCHNAYSYDRENPVSREAPVPTTRQSPVIDRAGVEDIVMVELSARDLAGRGGDGARCADARAAGVPAPGAGAGRVIRAGDRRHGAAGQQAQIGDHSASKRWRCAGGAGGGARDRLADRG